MNKEELNNLIKSEGNYYEWNNKIKCFIQRNDMNAWCGYIIIPKAFPLDFEKEIRLNCHGGITYQSINTDGDLVVGFDCAHNGDLVPKLLELGHTYLSFLGEDSTYRDKQYVIDEVNSMVEQIIKITEINRHLKINKILDSN